VLPTETLGFWLGVGTNGGCEEHSMWPLPLALPTEILGFWLNIDIGGGCGVLLVSLERTPLSLHPAA
jgi:hypothetical protein